MKGNFKNFKTKNKEMRTMKKILLMSMVLAAFFVIGCTAPVDEDIIAPTVSSVSPAASAVDVSISGNISATFDEEMDSATIVSANFTLKQGATSVPGAVSYAGDIATFNPTNNLAVSTVYTATVSTGVLDLAGNALAAAKVWTFTTAAAPDTAAPMVSSTSPAASATAVAKGGNVTATFSEEMDSATITAATFTLKQGSTSVPGAVSYAGNVATYNPTGDLALSTVYTATITVGAKDMAGNALAAAKVWTFTTEAAPPVGPDTVVLGTAGNYVILAKTGITTTGVTAITGDIAVSPIGAAAMTGFGLIMDSTNTFSTSSLVTGNVYASDYTEPTPTNLTAAILAMQAAYDDAAGRTIPDFAELGTGEIGGETLVAGLYNWTTGVSITTDVTLSGGPDDVWIFQIAGGITQAATAQVLMTGGALPENVFWQVAGAVALAATSHMEGTVMSAGAISLAAGATVDGRLMSQTAVTLDANTIVEPAL